MLSRLGKFAVQPLARGLVTAASVRNVKQICEAKKIPYDKAIKHIADGIFSARNDPQCNPAPTRKLIYETAHKTLCNIIEDNNLDQFGETLVRKGLSK